MNQREFPKAYRASEVEDAIYSRWESSGYFTPEKLPGDRREIFSIAMPPPNATGILHIGHAMFLSIQDLIVRYQRMRGKKTLWLPGTDHAAIATQSRVERLLQKEGKTKYDLGREQFLERIQDYVSHSQHIIRKQFRKMGASCDWSRERFTLDDGLSSAVRYAFVRMYREGLIYRGERIVNWCIRCESTLADDEVEYEEKKTKFYYFRYGPFIIGTARPETKMGDKAVIVHPDDPRYKKYHGKEFDTEWIDGTIHAKVIADPVADPQLGTGAMTITPAHSFVDFELAKKYHLPIVKMIDEKGRLTQANGKYAGMTVSEARERFVEILKSKGLLDHIDENYVHRLSVCYRCGTPIEPLPKEQWFIDVNKPVPSLSGKSLKEKAIEVVKEGRIEIIPQRFEKIYFHWMENLRDWCISRQIWYGHRIPVWYRKETGEIFVDIHPPQGEGWEQDPDTLDTWFSSGLWTFSTLGWPEETQDFQTYHPTSLMETGYDILFFWVARMILLSNFLVGDIPFRAVYLHGLVRDEQGRKMSKSLDNIIDPLEIIPHYGADAIRLSLTIGTSPGNDVHLGESKIAGYRNFVNKLWNISRYILQQTEPHIIENPPLPETLADEWILAAFHQLIIQSTDALERYQFSSAGEMIYEFTWRKFADWYIEICKIPQPDPSKKQRREDILNYILQNLLKLWHPFCPFVTDEIWKRYSDELLMIQPWPTAPHQKINTEIFEHFQTVQKVIVALRSLRAKNNIPLSEKPSVIFSTKDRGGILESQKEIIQALAGVSDFQIIEPGDIPKGYLAADVVDAIGIFLPQETLKTSVLGEERIQKEIERVQRVIQKLENRLADKNFQLRAPEDVVKMTEAKLYKQKEKLQKLQRHSP